MRRVQSGVKLQPTRLKGHGLITLAASARVYKRGTLSRLRHAWRTLCFGPSTPNVCSEPERRIHSG
jgi:hypothetical protein